MNSYSTYSNKNIVVFGAAGRIGLPLSVYLTKFGDVTGIDLDQRKIDKLNTGSWCPHKETGLKNMLNQAVNLRKTLTFSVFNRNIIANAKHIVIMVGTHAKIVEQPIGFSSYQPNHDDVFAVVEQLKKCDLKGKCVYLRSTVTPGITDKIYDIFESVNNVPKGLYYWPERVSEGNALKEFNLFPNIIGNPEKSISKLGDPFMPFTETEILHNGNYAIYTLSAREAEFAKLAANVSRYTQFAISNELLFIAETHGLNFNKIHKILGYDYPRYNIPDPGPNVGGPCLEKDYLYLHPLSNYSNIFHRARIVNKNLMPEMIIAQLKRSNAKTVLLLGTAFKPESDNHNYGLAEKIRTKSVLDKIRFDTYDPYAPAMFNDLWKVPWHEYDAVVITTPHECYNNEVYPVMHRFLKEGTTILNYWVSRDKYGFEQ